MPSNGPALVRMYGRGPDAVNVTELRITGAEIQHAPVFETERHFSAIHRGDPGGPAVDVDARGICLASRPAWESGQRGRSARASIACFSTSTYNAVTNVVISALHSSFAPDRPPADRQPCRTGRGHRQRHTHSPTAPGSHSPTVPQSHSPRVPESQSPRVPESHSPTVPQSHSPAERS